MIMSYKPRPLKWDHELLQGLSKLMKPNKSEEYHSISNIKRGNNTPSRRIQRNVKRLLENLPPETFTNAGFLKNDKK